MNKKLFKYFIGLFFFIFSANIFAQEIAIPANITLKKSFNLIEKNSGYTFFYSNDDINVNQKLQKSYSAEIKTVLDELSGSFNFSYEIANNKIILKPIPLEFIQVQGYVLDESSLPIPGANVYIEKSNIGTITNNKGYFSIKELPRNAIIHFSFIGYQEKRIQVNKDTTIKMILEEDIASLNEIVVIAYGEESKNLLSGAVNSINLNHYVVNGQENLNRSLQAISTGVYVQSNAGTPGSSVNVKMRGVGSINAGTTPLYIIDGVPLISGDYSQIEFSGQVLDAMSDININDIENITLLKDASSSSLYGSRASNGVVLINTKKGTEKAPGIEFRTSFGIRNVANKLSLLNASQWKTVVNEEYITRGEIPPYTQQEIDNPEFDTDWQNHIFRDAFFHNYNLSSSGGNKKTNYYVSGNLRSDEGVIIGTDLKNYGLRMNYENQVFNFLDFTFRSNFYKTSLNRVEGDQSLNGPLPNALSLPPIYPVYNADGSYFNDGPYANPVSIANEEKNLASVFRSLNSMNFSFLISEKLKVKSIFGHDYYKLREESYAPNTTRQGSKYNGYGIEANSEIEYFSNNTYLTYENEISSLKYKITSGFNIEDLKEHFNYLRAQDFPGGDMQYLDAAATTVTASSYAEESRLQSAFGRLNLNIKEKYILSFNTRLDGSSKFGYENKYGFFPSVSGLWYLSKEDIFSSNNQFEFFKIRASVGQVGNDRIGNYLHFNLLQTGNNYNGEPGISPYQLQNAELKWETTTHYNFGFDLGVLKSLHITTDFYYKLTSDLLLEKPMPPSSGYTYILSNIGKVENYGVEIEAKYVKRFNEIVWSSQLVFSSYKNKVLELYENQPIRNIGRARASIEEGKPISFFYGFSALGVDSQTGDLIYEDIDDDGNITDADRKYLGSPHPDFYGGFLNALSYKNLRFSILLNYMFGNEIYNGTKYYKESFSEQDNMLTTVIHRWKESGDDTDIPKFGSQNELFSSRYIENGSYIKIKQVQLRYSFGEIVYSKIKKLDIFISLENIYTFTNYSGMDPEVNYDGANNIRMGTDFFTCPQPRTLLIGLCATF